MLKDESTEIDYVGPTLPALKSLLSLPCATPTDKETFSQLAHALLSACLHHIDEMRWVGDQDGTDGNSPLRPSQYKSWRNSEQKNQEQPAGRRPNSHRVTP